VSLVGAAGYRSISVESSVDLGKMGHLPAEPGLIDRQ
jgi:hypothetical protein